MATRITRGKGRLSMIVTGRCEGSGRAEQLLVVEVMARGRTGSARQPEKHRSHATPNEWRGFMRRTEGVGPLQRLVWSSGQRMAVGTRACGDVPRGQTPT